MFRKHLGFTLIEVLIVIGIFGILSAVLLANFGQAGQQSRDAERKADLRALQSALELYKLKNGRYPEGCNGPNRWSGQTGTIHQCPSGSQYIIGLAPEYIRVLPTDPRLNGTNSGYLYVVNSNGTVYKLIARSTVESEIVSGFDHEFKLCDINETGTAMCDATHPNNNRPAQCDPSNQAFQTSYAVWGGYAVWAGTPALIERYTEDILCDAQ